MPVQSNRPPQRAKQKEALFVVRETGPTSRTSSLKILCLWPAGWTSNQLCGTSSPEWIRYGAQQILDQNHKLDMTNNPCSTLENSSQEKNYFERSSIFIYRLPISIWLKFAKQFNLCFSSRLKIFITSKPKACHKPSKKFRNIDVNIR